MEGKLGLCSLVVVHMKEKLGHASLSSLFMREADEHLKLKFGLVFVKS